MSKMKMKKASGGAASDESRDVKESEGKSKVKPYNAQGSNVEREADDKDEGGEMKKGGRVKKRADGGKVMGDKPKMRLDRAKRKDGGRVGSDLSPMSSAAKSIKEAVGHKTTD